jgi:protein-S-isoprenylcysteine O-methyltransferase Ste14
VKIRWRSRGGLFHKKFIGSSGCNFAKKEIVSMRKILKQLLSFILPVTVLIIVPLFLEPNISIKHLMSFIPGLVLMIIGLSIVVITVSAFIRKGDGTLAPWSPTKKLVMEGMYAYVRNPMISGVLMVLLGESLSVLSLPIFEWALIFFIVNNIFFRVYEEPSLEKRFGDEYREYKRQVPRWIPRMKPYSKVQ